MKITNLMKLVAVLVLLLTPVITMIAQAVDPVEDVVDLVVNFDTLVGSMAGYAAIGVFLTALLNGWFKATKSWIKQVISWVVPIAGVLIVSLVFNVGFLADAPVIKVVIYGLGTGLVSNGIFDIAFVNTAVNWLVEKLGGTVKVE